MERKLSACVPIFSIMKQFKVFSTVFITLLLTISAFSQSKFYGKVVEVIDGKTMIVEPQAKVQIKLELQYIEIPEAEQQLHTAVKDHLQKLVLNKTVEFRPRGLSDQKTVGRVLLGNVDLSQQMLRDGAAWYAVYDQKIHDESISSQYQLNESQAKAEKRGVWSIPDLKPAWKFRAAKEEKRRQEELAIKLEEQEKREKLRAEALERRKQKAEQMRLARAKANAAYNGNPAGQLGIQVWQDTSVSGMQEKPGYKNLLTAYIPERDIEYTLTRANLSSYKTQKGELKIDSRTFHLEKGNVPPQYKNLYGIGFLTQSEKGDFAKSNDLVIYADKKTLNLGKAYRLYEDVGGAVQELLLYQIKASELKMISEANSVSVSLGNYKGSIGAEYKQMVKDLVTSTK